MSQCYAADFVVKISKETRRPLLWGCVLDAGHKGVCQLGEVK